MLPFSKIIILFLKIIFFKGLGQTDVFLCKSGSFKAAGLACGKGHCRVEQEFGVRDQECQV